MPSDTIVNPKEQCNAITLRSGREVELPKGFGKSVVIKKEDGIEDRKKASKDDLLTTSYDLLPPPQVKAYVPPIPYP